MTYAPCHIFLVDKGCGCESRTPVRPGKVLEEPPPGYYYWDSDIPLSDPNLLSEPNMPPYPKGWVPKTANPRPSSDSGTSGNTVAPEKLPGSPVSARVGPEGPKPPSNTQDSAASTGKAVAEIVAKENASAKAGNDGPPALSPTQMLDRVVEEIRRCLVCSDHQLTVLALWVLHTYCHRSFPVTPYLNICSAENQSGKSICLQLLCMLSRQGWIATAVPPAVLAHRVMTGQNTILLDDRHITFGASDKKSIVGLLNAGAREESWFSLYWCGSHDEDQPDSDHGFCPKAFAGSGPLPPSLASRCIPIDLERKKPDEPVKRLRLFHIPEATKSLVVALAAWADSNSRRLEEIAGAGPPAGMPSGLTFRQQECAGPLLHIADLIGRKWRGKASQAFAAIFGVGDQNLESDFVQLLSDLRAAFADKGDPPSLTTAELLACLHGLEDRPWPAFHKGKPFTPYGMSRLLGGKVRPHTLYRASEPKAKGYNRQELADLWERYVPRNPVAGHESAVTSPSAVANQPNKNAGGNGVTAEQHQFFSNIFHPGQNQSSSGVPGTLLSAEQEVGPPDKPG